MKKLVLFVAFFSIICFGSCKKQDAAQEENVGGKEEVTQPSPSADDESNQPAEASENSENPSQK